MIGSMWLGLSLLLGAIQDELPASWVVVAPKQAGFSVKMPGAPTQRQQTVKTATGELQVNLFIAEGSNEAVFVVSYSDFPEAEIKKGNVQKRLDHARDGAVSSARGQLRGEKTIELDKHPGREIAIEKNGELIARMRIYVVNRRLYQIMVLGKGTAASKDTASFLDSFRLIQ